MGSPFYFIPAYEAISEHYGEATADAWRAEVTAGPYALGAPSQGIAGVFEQYGPQLISLATGIPNPTGAIEAINEGKLPDLTEVAKMAWDDEWGMDSGTFQDISTGLQQLQGLRNLYTSLTDDSGNDVGGGEMVPVMGSIGGGIGAAVATGGIWLGTLLARALGRGAASAVFTAANGVRVRLAQLWPLVRKYGAQNVAGALGITVGALGTMLMQPGASTGRGGRKRGRGISARDVKTTRRTIKQLRSLTRMAGIGGGGYRRSASYRPRRRSRAYYC